MENIEAKKNWLKSEYTKRLAELKPDAERLWGKMNVQQMIEHMSDYVRIASGRTPMEVITAEADLPRMQGFLMSEKPFRENTPNSLMPDTPAATKHSMQEAAIEELQGEIDYFFNTFNNDKELKIANPFFGYLSFDMQVQLLHKHAWHHLKQFGIND
jgi:hypothetical protein